MIIKSAEFITGAVRPDQYPPHLPEIAFAGRSNAGKSSLINALVNRKKLVKTSSTPGKTQQINFFRINEAFTFVDLPGYGYAKVPLSVRRQWGPMIETYLARRSNLRGVVLILDIRRNPGVEETNLVLWLNRQGVPCIPVLTKADKLSRTQQTRQQAAIATALGFPPERLVATSAPNRHGIGQVWEILTPLLSEEPPPG